MRWIGQLATAINKTSAKEGKRRQVPAVGTSSPGARRRHLMHRRGN